MNSHKNSTKTNTPLERLVRLVDQLREHICYGDYSARTEEVCGCEVKQFVRFQKLRHLRDMGR